jgi:single-strand DNA-binding protein
MATRSLNKVMLIGNVVRDPELRYTPQNTAVCTFTVATNRSWTGSDGSEQESAEYTRIVCWAKLAEIANQILSKGRKVYVEGRLQTRQWESKEGEKRQQTEVIAEQMLALDAPRGQNGGHEAPAEGGDYSYPEADAAAPATGKPAAKKAVKKEEDLEVADNVASVTDLSNDIPF